MVACLVLTFVLSVLCGSFLADNLPVANIRVAAFDRVYAAAFFTAYFVVYGFTLHA